jgi:lysyl-tRNA synthetase class II
MSELMCLLCIEYKVCSLPYFMDKMQSYEITAITEKLNLSVKNDWEICRQLAYVFAQINSKKKLKPSDIMKFPWEEDPTKKRYDKKMKVTQEMKDRMIREMELNKEKILKLIEN